MHLVRAKVCSLRVGRQTGAGRMSKTSQKRRNGKAPCLGSQQETIIQHIEIVKQRGQIECLTPLLFPIFDSLLGEFGEKDLFFLQLPCASSKKRCTHRTLTSSKTVWTYAMEALASLRRVHPFLLDAREATGFPAAISPAASPCCLRRYGRSVSRGVKR